MRPTPVRHSDAVLAPVCVALGIEKAPGELPPEMRAMVNAIYNAQTNPRASRPSQPRARSGHQAVFGFDKKCVDIKRRAANDLDEE